MGPTRTASGERLVTVFEIVNDTLREAFVGTTSLPIHELIRQHEAALPKKIAHWDRRHKIQYRSLEFSLSPETARAFIAGYAKSMERMTWRLIRD